MTHPIRIGIGGWNYEPWEETFYPDDLAKKRQLEYASRQLTAIEINSTFYRNQKPHVFENWAEQTPDGFKFTVKAQRLVYLWRRYQAWRPAWRDQLAVSRKPHIRSRLFFRLSLRAAARAGWAGPAPRHRSAQ